MLSRDWHIVLISVLNSFFIRSLSVDAVGETEVDVIQLQNKSNGGHFEGWIGRKFTYLLHYHVNYVLHAFLEK